MFSWRILIGSETFEYFTGLGHGIPITNFRTPKNFDTSKDHIRTRDWFIYVPQIRAVLECLFMDSAACDESFADWCSNFGYDTDSRSALDTYLACQENAKKLRVALGNSFYDERAKFEERMI